jgi:hypothetical protein
VWYHLCTIKGRQIQHYKKQKGYLVIHELSGFNNTCCRFSEKVFFIFIFWVLFNLPVYILISIRIIFWGHKFSFCVSWVFFQSTFNTGNKYKIFYYMQNKQY